MDWRALEARVDGVMARSFGEKVRLSFMTAGQQDPTRPPVEIRAVLHVGGDRTVPIGPGDNYRTKLSLGTAELLLDRSTYTGPIPKPCDKVRALDRAGEPWFEVASVSDRFSNLIIVNLGT